MNGIISRLQQRQKEKKGQGLVEYALILVLVAIVVIAVLTLFGETLAQTYCTVVVELNRGTGAKTSNACGSPVVTCNPISASRFEAVVVDPDIDNGVTLTEEITVLFYVNGSLVRTEEIEKFCLGGGGDGTAACSTYTVNSGDVIRAVASDQDDNTGECTYTVP